MSLCNLFLPLRSCCVLVILFAGISVTDVVQAAETVQLTEFDNGLRLLVVPQSEMPLASVEVYLSLRGAARNGGLAHLIEHLMFQSSRNCPAGSLRDSLQLLATYYNGMTSPRNIRTETHCLPSLLPRLLAVEAERFGRLQPGEADLAHEKQRVLGEHDFRYEALTRQALLLRIIAMAYGDGKNGDPLLGSREMVESYGLAEVEEFITHWLRPDHMVVVVSGPVDVRNVVASAAATFGALEPVGEEPEILDLPERPDPRSFVTHTEDQDDLLAVGFRLPYGTPEEMAIVHLTETIMDRESGNPSLVVFEDEALLILNVWGDWSEQRTDEGAADAALDQFWEETRKVIYRTRNDWIFEKNRSARVADLRERMSRPRQLASWRAQLLADDRDLCSPGAMATMIDSLGQDRLREFFIEQFADSLAFTAFAAGRPPKDYQLTAWNRYQRLKINPYLIDSGRTTSLGKADVAPNLTEAAALSVGKIETATLTNGIPVLVLEHRDADRIYTGGIRTLPCLEDEALDEDPGRLLLYNILVDLGYDTGGSRIAPAGQHLGWHTNLDAPLGSLMITSEGPADRFEDVVAAMHKRIEVDRLNPYAFRWAVDNFSDWGQDLLDLPVLQAQSWRTQAVLGQDHPLAGWLTPDSESIADWSVGKANKLHRKLCETGNLQLVVTGGADIHEARAVFLRDFAERDDVEAEDFPSPTPTDRTVQGGVCHDGQSTVAVTDFMFPVRALDCEPVLSAMDILILERLMTMRLQSAVAAADLDSVNTAVMIQPVGASVLPQVQIISPPAHAALILDLVSREAKRLRHEPPTIDEESRARLEMMGPLLELLQDPREARDFLLSTGLYGEIPVDPLGDLEHREYGILAAQVADLFPHDSYAWTVTGDTTLAVIRNLGPIVH